MLALISPPKCQILDADRQKVSASTNLLPGLWIGTKGYFNLNQNDCKNYGLRTNMAIPLLVKKKSAESD